MPKKTKKQFIEFLNAQYPFNPNNNQGKGYKGKYKPTKRGYGDYLYSQDREMFNRDYQNWLNGELGK